MIIFPFAPSIISEEALEHIFVQHNGLADYFIQKIQESVLTETKQYHLLIGKNGIGKSHLICLIYYRIRRMEDFKHLLIAQLKEEEFGINSFLDLLVRVIKSLDEYDVSVNEKIEDLYKMPSSIEQAQAASDILRKMARGRKIILIVENLHNIFSSLNAEGRLRFYSFLQENCYTVLATSQSNISNYQSFNDIFNVSLLPELTVDKAVHLMSNIANLEGKTELENFIKSPNGRNRIRVVHYLLGGLPRLYIIFSKFITSRSLDQLEEPLLATLEAVSPYCSVKLDLLSPQQKKIIEVLADYRYALSVNEIAQRCFTSGNSVSSQLKELRDKNYVISESVGRESFYELKDPIIGFWLIFRRRQQKTIRLLIDFLKIWFDADIIENNSITSISEGYSRCQIILENYTGEDAWRTEVSNLIEFFHDRNSVKLLSHSLVRTIPILTNMNNEIAKLWLNIWQDLAGLESDFFIPLQILNTTVNLKQSDRRALLKLPRTERSILEDLLLRMEVN